MTPLNIYAALCCPLAVRRGTEISILMIYIWFEIVFNHVLKCNHARRTLLCVTFTLFFINFQTKLRFFIKTRTKTAQNYTFFPLSFS